MKTNNKKMIQYQYQILRYIHDIATEEFANIGIVMFAPKFKFLKSKGIKKYTRISSFFTKVPGNFLVKSIKQFEENILNYCDQLISEFSFQRFNSITDITEVILPKDDSSLQLSKVFKGITLDLEETFEYLFNRYIREYETMSKKKSRSDKDVWKEAYKKYFDQYGINKKLKPHIVKTKNDTFEFDYSVKNGIYHCYEPVSFDLTNSKDLKEKTYKWDGRITELGTAEERMKLYILSATPQNPNNANIITIAEEKLTGKRGNVQVEFIKEDNAEVFVARERKILEKQELF